MNNIFSLPERFFGERFANERDYRLQVVCLKIIAQVLPPGVRFKPMQ